MIDHSRFTSKDLIIISILILIILNVVIYWNIQNHAFINYDDQLYVTSNHRIQAGITLKSVFNTFTDTHTGNWHPLTMISHLLDWQLFGERAGGHHWTRDELARPLPPIPGERGRGVSTCSEGTKCLEPEFSASI